MRSRIFVGIILFVFGILIIGLYYTQVVKHSVYKELSENNRVRVLRLASPRGRIFDRKGRLLVNNRISFDIEVIYQEVKAKKKVARILAGLLDIDKNKLLKRIEKAKDRPFVPVMVAEDIDKEKAIRVEETKLDLPGIVVTTRPLRNYIYKNAFSHVIGYLGKISEPELRKYKTYGYDMQDYVGKDGVERTFNEYLRGTDGGLQVEVDSRGRQLRNLAVKEPTAGKDLYLTLDLELQKFCEEILSKKRGAIVAMDPQTGAVLALVSGPNFDPNIFVSANNDKEKTLLLNNKGTFPMMNRATGGAHPPGSVFKIVVAIAALETDKFNDKKTFVCNGSYRVGNRTFHCWREKGHGTLNIIEGIKNSCNVFFYQLGLLLGVDTISKYASKLGLGEATGIELPGELKGIVPTVHWKRRKLKEPWFKGETANYSIGQGYLLVTPLQIARSVSVVANGGRLVKPFIVEKIEDIKLEHENSKELGLSKNTMRVVKEGLRQVVNEPRGTGLYARSKDVVISGKTGTAQNPRGASHAWFVGFAEFNDPKLCVVVFIEHGGKGGLNPARFTKQIMEEAKKLELI